MPPLNELEDDLDLDPETDTEDPDDEQEDASSPPPPPPDPESEELTDDDYNPRVMRKKATADAVAAISAMQHAEQNAIERAEREFIRAKEAKALVDSFGDEVAIGRSDIQKALRQIAVSYKGNVAAHTEFLANNGLRVVLNEIRSEKLKAAATKSRRRPNPIGSTAVGPSSRNNSTEAQFKRLFRIPGGEKLPAEIRRMLTED